MGSDSPISTSGTSRCAAPDGSLGQPTCGKPSHAAITPWRYGANMASPTWCGVPRHRCGHSTTAGHPTIVEANPWSMIPAPRWHSRHEQEQLMSAPIDRLDGSAPAPELACHSRWWAVCQSTASRRLGAHCDHRYCRLPRPVDPPRRWLGRMDPPHPQVAAPRPTYRR